MMIVALVFSSVFCTRAIAAFMQSQEALRKDPGSEDACPNGTLSWSGVEIRDGHVPIFADAHRFSHIPASMINDH